MLRSRFASPRRIRFSPLAAVFVLAAGVRLAYALWIHPDALVWADELTYDRIARRLLETGRFESHPYDANPGWPLFLAGIYAVFGHDYTAARVAQALLGGVLAVAVAGTGSIFFGRRTGLLAGTGVALYPPLIYLAAVLYADHLGAVLLATSVWALASWQRDRAAWRLLPAGLLLGATALTRPAYLALLPIAAIYVLVQARPERRLRDAVALALIAAATIAPWTVRNAFAYGSFVPVSTGFGVHLWRGNNELARGDADDRHLLPLNDVWLERAAALPPAQRAAAVERAAPLAQALERLEDHPVRQDALLREAGTAWIRRHPGDFAQLAVAPLATLYSPFSRTRTPNDAGSPRNRLIAALSFIPVLLLALPGAVLALRRTRGAWIVHAAILTPTALYAVLTAATRFRLPIDPLWILLASVTVTAALDALARRAAGAAHPRAGPAASATGSRVRPHGEAVS